MKNPAALLKYPSVSLSLCLLAQYLSGTSSEAFFAERFSGARSGMIALTVFSCFCRLSALFFGIFLYCRMTSSAGRFPFGYFSGFSLVLSFLAGTLVFADGGAAAAALWSTALIFFLSVLLFAPPREKPGVLLLGLPQLGMAAACFAVSMIRLFF